MGVLANGRPWWERSCSAQRSSQPELSICLWNRGHSSGIPERDHLNTQRRLIVHDMMGSGMMWGMGLLWLLLAVLLVLGIAALAKYVFFR